MRLFSPAIFAIMQLMAAISSSSRRIEFYFDMHSHSNIKEAFIYGNALEDIIKQSYSQLFCRVLEENSLWFRSNYC